MVKRCAYGVCNSDSRYPQRNDGIRFIPFPKPRRTRDKCKRWLKACGRPHYQLNFEKITKDTYVCSKHFHDPTGPTEEYPDPIPVDWTTASFNRFKRTRVSFNMSKAQRKIVHLDLSTHDDDCPTTSMSVPGSPDTYSAIGDHVHTSGAVLVEAATQTEGAVYTHMDMLANMAVIRQLQEENTRLKNQLSSEEQQLQDQAESNKTGGKVDNERSGELVPWNGRNFA